VVAVTKSPSFNYGFPFFIANNQPNTGQPELSGAKPDVTASDAVPLALDLSNRLCAAVMSPSAFS